MLTHELKDYVVFRDDLTGNVLQCHKGAWANWFVGESAKHRNLTMLVNNVTQNEARQFCQLTRED